MRLEGHSLFQGANIALPRSNTGTVLRNSTVMLQTSHLHSLANLDGWVSPWPDGTQVDVLPWDWLHCHTVPSSSSFCRGIAPLGFPMHHLLNLWNRVSQALFQAACALLDKHLGHRWCIFLVSPHAGHLHSSVTSFKALPAICLCLFLECDVFFFGTALSIPSQMPSSRDGIEGRPSWNPAGMARERDGRKGSEIRRKGI